MDIFEILENIELEESAKTDFIAKFGEDTYNNFVKAKQRLANAGLSVDFGQYLKKTKEEVEILRDKLLQSGKIKSVGKVEKYIYCRDRKTHEPIYHYQCECK